MHYRIVIDMIKGRYNTNPRFLYDLSVGQETDEERGARRSSIIHIVVMIPVASLSDYQIITFELFGAVTIDNAVGSRYKQYASEGRENLYIFRDECNSRLLGVSHEVVSSKSCFFEFNNRLAG
jgi:hypothetical protein